MVIPAIAVDAIRHELPGPLPKATGTEGQTERLGQVWAGAEGVAGVWECTPGTFSSQKVGQTEVCQVLSGRATVRSDDGSVVEITAGSLVVLPDGWRGSWEVHETLRKSFVSIPTHPPHER